MRGTPTGRLRNGLCGLCSAYVVEEQHRAGIGDHTTSWWTPLPHAASCGQPCVAGGVEALRVGGRLSFDHAHRLASCGCESCPGGQRPLNAPGFHPPEVWRVKLWDGRTRVFTVTFYEGPNASSCWFAECGDGWSSGSRRVRSTNSAGDAAAHMMMPWPVKSVESKVTGPHHRITDHTARTLAAKLTRAERKELAERVKDGPRATYMTLGLNAKVEKSLLRSGLLVSRGSQPVSDEPLVEITEAGRSVFAATQKRVRKSEATP